MKDEIDFKNEPLGRLFAKIFVPTLLGMLSGAALNIADGMFVGLGIGSDALAAVNIVAPMYLLSSDVGLMFGTGASVVAAIHLSKGKIRTANINISQSIYVSMLIMAIVSVATFIFAPQCARMFGSTERLDPYAIEYLRYFVLICPLIMLECIGLFVIRLDGSPRYAMMCSVVPAVLNIILDYIFVFPMQMGIKGAALATDIGVITGALMIFYYLIFKSNQTKLLTLKLSKNSLLLTARNIAYMVRLGTSSLLGELAISFMMFLGNHIFLRHLTEDGVAAFSVLCYCFPVIFMLNTAIAQSAQPIISYNHGLGDTERVKKAFKLMLTMSITCGAITAIAIWIGRSELISMFLHRDTAAYNIAYDGMPYFALGMLFFAINIVVIGYYQSVEQARKAVVLTILRGFVFLGATFLLLPYWFATPGIWLAVPIAEMLTCVTIGIASLYKKEYTLQ
ncbi:MAG: MATE family efflux transporter [Paludibacteraceae bacterium]|nr:MATE family efflux transporter [Paludibacteraceae bacterium]